MDQLYRETRRLIVESRNLLEALESASANSQLNPEASSPVSETFRETINKLTINASSLRRNMAAEPPSRREVWRARLRDLEDQIGELRAGEARCTARLRKIATEQRMRDELLQRRAGGAGGAARNDVSIGMRLGDEARRLDDSDSTVGNILTSGRDTLQALLSQKDRLRGVRRRVLDILHQAGVDRQIIARIERREYSDMILMYALMAGILILLGIAVFWKHHRNGKVA